MYDFMLKTHQYHGFKYDNHYNDLHISWFILYSRTWLIVL